MEKHDFLIIGAGINGLLIARELLAAGASVLILDKGLPGQEASWAGGGIVSPLYPWRYSKAVTELANWAQGFYPYLAQELLEETGIDPELNRSGLLMLDAPDVDEAIVWARANQRDMQLISSAECYVMESQLALGYNQGLWMSDVCNVRNPRLVNALVASLHANTSATLVSNAEVRTLKAEGSRVRAIVQDRSAEFKIDADEIIVSSGAWSGKLLAGLGLPVKVEPVKGQMLLFKLAHKPCDAIILSGGRYVIPRADGHLLVGSTLEYTGFDKAVSDTAKYDLHESAIRLLPALENYEPISQWAGLRPAAPGGIPFIGRIANMDNLSICAGQFRNGLVLAPASARLLVDCVLQRDPIINPLPYKPGINLAI